MLEPAQRRSTCRPEPDHSGDTQGSKGGRIGVSAEEVVLLTMPASPEHVRLARVTLAGFASRLGFSWDEIEDLRLAIDELCFAIVGNEAVPGSLHLRYRISGNVLEVKGALDDTSTSRTPTFSEWSVRILAALVDAHGTEPDDPSPTGAWFRKTRLERAD